MPITNQTPLSIYAGNGATTIFPYTFKLLDDEDLSVYLDGTIQVTGYSISGVGDDGGGSVTFTVAPATDVVIRLERTVSKDRNTDYVEGGQLAASTLDNDFDRIVMMIQDSAEAPLLETPDGKFDAESKVIKNVATPVAGNDATNKTYVDSTIPANVAAAAASAAAASTSASNAATSETNAATSESNASTSAFNAAASAATIPTYPTLAGNGLKYTRLNVGATEMEFRTTAEVLSDIGAATASHNHSGVYSLTSHDHSGVYSLTSHNHSGTYEPVDTNLVRKNAIQSFTAPQRGPAITDNDLSFDLTAGNNFICTPTGAGTLTFTNLAAGQCGTVILINGSSYAISKAAAVKCDTNFLAKVSVTGSYMVSYYCDGTNVYVATTGALS